MGTAADVMNAKFGMGVGLILFGLLGPIPGTVKIFMVGIGIVMVTGFPFGVGYPSKD